MKKTFYILIVALTAIMAACGGKKEGEQAPDNGEKPKTNAFTDDKTIYGLACDGCTDSVVYLLPQDGSDPIAFNTIRASRRHQIIGRIKIGDLIGVVVNPKDSTVADMVIDIEQLKGTWCYIVMPTMRKSEEMTKDVRDKMAENPDSMYNLFFVPREYGFTLKRQNQAQPVGWVQQSTALEDESPVVYEEVPRYSEWHLLNGKLVLSRNVGKITANTFKGHDNKTKPAEHKMVNDTAEFIYMMDDSLVLQFKDHKQSYYRISNAADANKAAREKAQIRAKEAAKSITGETSEKVEQVQEETKKEEQAEKKQEITQGW